jgi:uncharacterized protein YecT (DUF1311 family)
VSNRLIALVATLTVVWFGPCRDAPLEAADAQLPTRTPTPVELQRGARVAYDAEMAHEGHDCPDANTQYDENICLGRVVETTATNFASFYAALAGLMSGDAPSLQTLEDSQIAWSDYQQKACHAIETLFRGGTILPSAGMGCVIQLTRSRMRDLNMLYDLPLHH